MQSENMSDWIVGTMVTVFGLLGLVMAIGARDAEIFIFGVSLLGFAAIFIWSLRRRHGAHAIPVAAKGKTHG